MSLLKASREQLSNPKPGKSCGTVIAPVGREVETMMEAEEAEEVAEALWTSRVAVASKRMRAFIATCREWANNMEMLNGGNIHEVHMRLAIAIMKGVEDEKAYMEVKVRLRSVR